MPSHAVQFPEGQTGSTLLRDALAEAVSAFPDVFGHLAVPADGRAFKRWLPDGLATFEARRVASDRRVDVARRLAAFVPARATLATDSGPRPLVDALRDTAARTAPHVLTGRARPGWVPEVSWDGRAWRGRELADLAGLLRERSQLTTPAAEALRRVADTWLDAPVDLRGHTFVVLGAAAELSPTPYLLAAGARVAWVDRVAPQLDPDAFAGTLVHAGASDLLGDPASVRATIAAEPGPLHLGLYAYAPGGGRELLLTTAMNAIADSLPPASVASVAMWVSPTTPGELSPDDRADRERRRATAPRWQRALARARVLREGSLRHGSAEISRSIVPLQGPTYLAAQVLGKRMVAERWVADHAPTRVSANVAGITHTRSLEHPLFLAGFLGAPAFGIEIFQPDATRTLATLLMLHDVLHPDAPAAAAVPPAERARRVAAQSVHGGVRTAPFQLDPTIRVAALLGLGRRPGLLLKLRGGP
jgi:hypothetical protein